AQTPTCPRCGYDLSGIVASWKDACPLTGICSECGLEFQWRYLLDPRFKIKPWFFEHALRSHARSFLYTLWRAVRPWSFWSWVRLEDEISLYRLGIFACLSPPLLGAATLLVMVPIAFVCGAVIWLDSNWVSPWDFVMGTLFAHSWRYDMEILLPLLGLMVSTAIAPGILMLFGDSMKLARVRRVHLLRVWVYSLVCVPWAYCILGFSSMYDWNAGRSSNWWSSPFFGVDLFLGRPRPTLLPAAGLALVIQMFVIRRAVASYLRLPSAWGVAFSVAVITALLTAVLAVLSMLWVYRQ
ncbi:MAG: hypothetical protein IID31_13820, partial [Planctomycetes bacterium]|nr:hypothetical protein [Planctomycetota bacterium]